MDKLYGLINRVCIDEKVSDNIIRTAHVVGRLYALQLEEIDYTHE
jgi:3-oxoacyl-[acyl-carrier-protein] synthase-3